MTTRARRLPRNARPTARRRPPRSRPSGRACRRRRRRRCGTRPAGHTSRCGCPAVRAAARTRSARPPARPRGSSAEPTIGHSRNMPRPVRSRYSSASSRRRSACAPPMASATPDGGSGASVGEAADPGDTRLRLDRRRVDEPLAPRTGDARMPAAAQHDEPEGCARATRPGRDPAAPARAGAEVVDQHVAVVDELQRAARRRAAVSSSTATSSLSTLAPWNIGHHSHHRGSVIGRVPLSRMPSGCRVDSTWITSAPSTAHAYPMIGPAQNAVRSMIRIPASGRLRHLRRRPS